MADDMAVGDVVAVMELLADELLDILKYSDVNPVFGVENPHPRKKVCEKSMLKPYV